MPRPFSRRALIIVTALNVGVMATIFWAIGLTIGGLLGAVICWNVCDACAEMLRDARVILRRELPSPDDVERRLAQLCDEQRRRR